MTFVLRRQQRLVPMEGSDRRLIASARANATWGNHDARPGEIKIQQMPGLQRHPATAFSTCLPQLKPQPYGESSLVGDGSIVALDR